jgi:hypothetical protein
MTMSELQEFGLAVTAGFSRRAVPAWNDGEIRPILLTGVAKWPDWSHCGSKHK